jgi:hypothetical protein
MTAGSSKTTATATSTVSENEMYSRARIWMS